MSPVAASGVATGVFIGLRQGELDDLDRHCAARTHCDPSVQAIVDRGTLDAAMVNVFGALTLASLAGGSALLLSAPSATPARPAALALTFTPAVGPRGAVPFLASGVGAATTRCDPGSGAPGDASCAVPLGGLSLWESSLELRFPLVGAFSGSTFCDVSDASPARVNLRFTYPHLSCGLGLRYDTPIGPVRLDVGYRIPGAQVPAAEAAAVEAAAGSFFTQYVSYAYPAGASVAISDRDFGDASSGPVARGATDEPIRGGERP